MRKYALVLAALALVAGVTLVVPGTAGAAPQKTCMGYPVDVVGTAGDDDLGWAMDQDWDLNGDGRQVILGMGGNDRVDLGAPASGDPDWVFFCGGRGRDFAGGIHGFNGGHGKDTMERWCLGRAKSVERFIDHPCRDDLP